MRLFCVASPGNEPYVDPVAPSQESPTPSEGRLLNEDRPERVAELFASALERPPQERATYLAAAGASAAVQAEVLSLLRAHETRGRLDRMADQLSGARAAHASRLTSTHRFEPGAVLNGVYRIDGVLGEGGMGVVYRAVDQLRDRVVALKTVRGDALTPEQVELFKAEFRTLTELKHPNVAAAYDFEPIRGTDAYLFTMEYIEGQTVFQATDAAAWSDVLDLLVPVCRALAYVHSRQFIHFDLKPENVLVDGRNVVKVLDFGVAGVRHAGTPMWRGTPHYMAPELMSPDAPIDHRADLYSLGIMAYELLCRRLPFNGPTPFALAAHHHGTPLVFDAEAQARVPEWLRKVVERLCAKLPADRYRSANAIIEDLNRRGERAYELDTKQTRESYVLSSRFVGRDAQCRQILGFTDRRVTGDAPEQPALFVAGVSGVGKSRLMREVRLQAQLSQIVFLESACYEGSFVEYGPLLTVIEHLVRIAETAGATALLKRYGPELMKLSPRAVAGRGIEPSPPLENAELERLRLMDQVTEFFVRVAEIAPYVIYLDDLQWATAGTVDLLTYLIRRVALEERGGRRLQCGILGTYRDDEVHGRPVEKLLRGLEALYCSVHLAPLDRTQVGTVLSSMLGVEALPAPFVERVADETAGNAFFVEEVMRSLIENGSVYLENGEWAARERIGELQIPAGIEALFRRRTSFLDAGPRAILDLMAVHGQPITAGVLEAVGGVEPQTLHAYLAQLQRRQMVRPVPGDTVSYQLLHDRMREILYRDLEDEHRRTLHRGIGAALEALSDAESHVYDLAYHFWQAGDAERALTYSLRAGERAERSYANARAIELFERVLQLLPASGRPDAKDVAARVTETLGDLHSLQGDFEQALASYRTLLTNGTTERDRARLFRKLGQVHWQKGELAEAVEELWNAAVQLGDGRPASRLGGGLATLGAVLTHLGHRIFRTGRREHRPPEERARLLELTHVYSYLGEVLFFHNPAEMLLPTIRAANRGERAGGDSRELVVAYKPIMVVYGTLTLWGSARTYAQKLAGIAERLESDWHVGIGHAYWLILHYYAAEWARGIEAGHKAKDLLLRCGDMAELSFVYWLLSLCHYYRGNLSDALAIAKEGITTMERSDSAQPSKGILAVGARVQARLGDFQGAREALARSVTLCEQAQDRFFSTWVQMMQGDCHLFAGEVDQAVACLDAARQSREKHGLLPEFLVEIYPLLATALLEQLRRDDPGLDPAERRERLSRASKIARQGVRLSKRRHGYHAPALRAAGTAAFLSGQRDRAWTLFSRSIVHAEKVGASLQLGETHLELGRCLKEAGDQQQARRQFDTALDLFERAQAGTYVERANSLNGG